MTPEEIKKIAEEYIAYKYPKSYKEMKPYTLKNAIKVISEMIEYLTERYFIVEKGKVEDTYNGYKFLSRKHPKASERRIAEVATHVFEHLFGPEIGKEDGNE